MTVYLKNFILTALVLALPAGAYAQRRVPATGSGAIGGDVGVFLPRDAGFNAGPALEGFYEYYLTARDSVRIGVGWANPKRDNNESGDSLRHVRVAMDLVHNWEGGAIHPFVGAGVGIYFLQFRDNGVSVGDAETKFGGTIFGGAEFFASRTTSVKAEVKYHVIQNIGVTNPDGLALMIGLKKYF